jgi:diaminopimelate epimerase
MTKSNKEIDFFKYSAFGNDFILFDNLKNNLDVNLLNIKNLCDRNFGVGADGVIILSNDNKLLKMDIFNRDSSKAKMCGNALISTIKYLIDHNIKKNNFDILVTDKTYEAGIEKDKYFFISENPKIIKLNYEFLIDNKKYLLDLIDTQNKHCLVYVDNLDNLNVNYLAAKIRKDSFLKNLDLNVHFIKKDNENVNVRVFENGVNDETLACASGALAIAYTLKNKCSFKDKIKIKYKIASYEIDFSKINKAKFISNSKLIFSGKIKL